MSYKRIARHCAACLADRPDSYGIPDPCLGWLPGVRNACCGHGSAKAAYVQWPGKPEAVRGQAALDLMRDLGGNPPEPTNNELSEDKHWPKGHVR